MNRLRIICNKSSYDLSYLIVFIVEELQLARLD